MSLDRHVPGRHPLARRGIFGNPYHGLVAGGEVVLPNAAVRPYPQPDATWPDQAGTAHLLRRPGQPAVERTEEQAEADSLAGLQWRNQAMLSGGRQQLYGEDLDGWVFIGADGKRWLIKVTTDLNATSFAFSSSLTLDFQISRFGEFGGSAVSYSASASLSDWGQSGYGSLPGFQEGGSTPIVTSARLMIDAIHTAGAKVALCAHVRRLESLHPIDPTNDVAVRHALGWLQIEVTESPLPSVSLSVLKSRAQTLVVVEKEVVDSPEVHSLPPLVSPGPVLNLTVGTFSYAFEAQRFIAAWANPDSGDWTWVCLRYRDEGESVYTLETVGLAYVVHTASTSSASYAIDVDGVEQISFDGFQESEGDRTFTYSEDGGYAALEDQRQAVSTTLEFDGDSYPWLGTAGGITRLDGSSGFVSYTPPDVSGNSGGFYSADASSFLPLIFALQWRFQLRINNPFPSLYSIAMDVCRQSGQVFTLRAHLISDDDDLDDFRYKPLVTPSGVVGSGLSTSYSADERFYGSWCPHAAQTVGMQTSPVCWV